MNSEFNALQYARRLEAAGVSKDQAEVHAQSLAEVVCLMAPAKQLLTAEQRLRHDMAEMEQRLNSRIDAVRTEVIAKFDIARTVLDARIDKLCIQLEARLDRLEAELRFMKWVIGMQVGLAAAILIKLFFP